MLSAVQSTQKRNSAPADPRSNEELLALFAADPENDSLRNAVEMRFMPLVKFNAERIASRLPREIDPMDLMQAGYFGLRDAVFAFDPSRGVKFETYCVPRIRGAMLDELRSMDWVPRLVRHQQARLNDALARIRSEDGDAEITDELLAEHMGLSLDELQHVKEEAAAPMMVSLSRQYFTTDSEKDVRLIDINVDPKSEDPSGRLHNLDLLRKICAGGSKAERLMLIMWMYEGAGFRDIGEQLDLSESRISQMMGTLVMRIYDRFKGEFNTSRLPYGLQDILERSAEGSPFMSGEEISGPDLLALLGSPEIAVVSFSESQSRSGGRSRAGTSTQPAAEADTPPSTHLLLDDLLAESHPGALVNFSFSKGS